ncbi:MAG: hypothetical protein JXA33_05605, partial [Anaerolineae bacterium]|nr:hypothetical protein [Anaerolineae bacterium]
MTENPIEVLAAENEKLRIRNQQLEREIAELRRVETDLKTSAAKTNALYRLARVLVAYETLPALLQAVASTVAKTLPATQVILHIYDMDAKQVAYFVEGRPDPQHPFHPPFAALMESVIGWAVAKVQPVLSPKAI